MQIPWKQTLGLIVALSAMSCGDTEPFGDTYQGYIDGSALSFQPTGQCGPNKIKCYAPQTVTVNGDPVAVYNLGLVSNPNSNKATPPAPIWVDTITTLVYEFPNGCVPGPAYDPRIDAYDQDHQYPVFGKLSTTTSSTAPAVPPMVRVVKWSGSEKYTCNSIKSVTSVDEGKYVLTQQQESTVSLRAIIAPFEARQADGTVYTPPLGWYKGLLLNYLDAGDVPVDEQGNLVTMDGVLVSPPTGSSSSASANNVLVLAARPGEVGWSPVVKLRDFKAAANTTPASYKSLCYDAPCAATAVNMAQATTYNGTLFLATGAP